MKALPVKEWFLTLLAYAITVTMPLIKILLGVALLLFFDYVIGRTAAKNRGEEFDSKKSMRAFLKALCYLVAIIVSFTMEVWFGLDGASKIVAGAIAFMQLRGIDKNVKEVTGFSVFEQFIKNK